MINTQNNIWKTLMVIGDNYKELIEPFNLNNPVERYIKYKYKDAKLLKDNEIKLLKQLIEKYKYLKIDILSQDFLNMTLHDLEKESLDDYYSRLTSNLFLDENNDAWSTENPNGKYRQIQHSGNYSIHLPLNNNTISYTSTNDNIKWNQIHGTNKELYEIAWDIIINNKKPSNDIEKQIKANMLPYKQNMLSFNSKDEYIAYNTNYWCNSVIYNNQWFDMDDHPNHKEWVINFYDNFIKNLKPNDNITILEYSIIETEEI